MRTSEKKVSSISIKPHKLIYDMSSTAYHSHEGTFSSSQLKDLLDDEERFIGKYITKAIERESIDAFDVGTYFHTGILEPHKIKEDCVVYPGTIKSGNKWEKFKEDNKNKAILTSKQQAQAEKLIEVAKDSPITMSFVKDGAPEVSLFNILTISRGEIYSEHFSKRLTRDGWVDGQFHKDKKSINITIKTRADVLGNTYIFDLKSTTGNAKNEFQMKQKISAYKYDLSAALYLDMFSLVNPLIRSFIWGFASKDFLNCKSWTASKSNILVGRAKYTKAILKLAELIRNDYQMYDCLGELGPMSHELEYLQERETDLL